MSVLAASMTVMEAQSASTDRVVTSAHVHLVTQDRERSALVSSDLSL